MTSDVNNFVIAKSHAREKPLLTGQSAQSKIRLNNECVVGLILCCLVESVSLLSLDLYHLKKISLAESLQNAMEYIVDLEQPYSFQ